ncbi:hypothetical protein FSARC_11838 [Fusarium sarcochroum]|uniref:Carrier domain-containing protein n=1 Tax=Fusarium sarcochroum TaxID=1208366 RepID=A0A8H4WZI5_9HYPO|nr:hypothetical protein FSARC_11838 [Fusarium sarcochroum]
MRGSRFAGLETSDEEMTSHTITRLYRQPDISLLPQEPGQCFGSYLKKTLQRSSMLPSNGQHRPIAGRGEALINTVIDIVAHKTPTFKVLGLNLAPQDTSSLWLGTERLASGIREACSQFHIVCNDPKSLAAAKERYGTSARDVDGLMTALESVEAALADDGYILILFAVVENFPSQIHQAPTDSLLREDHSGSLHELENGIYLYARSSSKAQALATPPVEVLQVSLVDDVQSQLSETLESLQPEIWVIRRCANPLEEICPGQTIWVLDELFDSVMPHLSASQLQILQHIVQQECEVLWVTSGAHLKVAHPARAAINEFLRVIRVEEPTLRLITLDVEQHNFPATAKAIQTCLRLLHDLTSSDLVDSEFFERDDVLFISRVLPDVALTKQQSDEISELETEVVVLHANVVVTLGIVPGNEHTLGGEGAGIVTRVSPCITSFKPGQRVVIYQKGTFANRVQKTPDRAHIIPDDMSFEEAAALCIVYMTSVYSLFDMGDVVQGSKVLIHSRAGGVGIAAIQLCQYAGAQLYITVGTKQKRQLSDDQIFDSRTTAFVRDILAATDGKGVDVILNSLSGNLLDELWRILADGGLMAEIGKRDILDRNHLAMEPFDRNVSFRAVEMSHERVSGHLASRLMSQLSQLIKQAIRFLRAGTHIGKVVITDGAKPDVRVPWTCGRKVPRHCTSSSVARLQCRPPHGDVTNASNVEVAIQQTTVPVSVIIQGAMVLRDLTFSSMTIDDYHGALACKIQGAWNLHNIAEQLDLELDFFAMLSSISGVVGQKDLGVIEDLGYIHDNEGMQEKLDMSLWKGINERLLRKIVHLSILHQQCHGKGQGIIPIPQPKHSRLRRDVRFAGLFTHGGREVSANKGGSGGNTESKDVQVLLLSLRSESPERGILVTATVEVIGKCLMRVLRLSKPMEKDRPISVYGIDSLAAVDVRNWIRMHLGALMTTLDIMNSSSLVTLCEKILDKVTCAGKT